MNKGSPDAVSSAMKDHTIRRMYTKRASGDINIYAMKEDLTTQEISKKEKGRLYFQNWYKRNKQKISNYYFDNKDKIKTQRKQREKTLESKEKRKKYHTEYCLKNKEKIRAYRKSCHARYYQTEKIKRSKYASNYFKRIDVKNRINAKRKERKAKDIDFRFRVNLRISTLNRIKAGGGKKDCEITELLGCSIEDVRRHIEQQWLPGMTWENHAKNGWHIDHIKPCNTFNLADPEQQKQCFHYTNLRPLWAVDNLSRPKNGSDIKR
jgi:hypothetical protein